MWWMAVAGAAAGQISYLVERDKRQNEIERQKALAQQAYGYRQEYSNSSFNLQREESLENLGIQQNRLARAFNADIEGFNLNLAGQALDTQGARISLADSMGGAVAAQGAGGTRGSGGLQMRMDYAQRDFDRRLALQERGNSLTLRNMAAQYSNQFDDIGREIDSWMAGGYKTRAKDIQDLYASRMHGLELEGYDAQMSELNDPWNTAMGFLTAGFGGASTGAGLGAQIDRYREQAAATQTARPVYSNGLNINAGSVYGSAYGGNANGFSNWFGQYQPFEKRIF